MCQSGQLDPALAEQLLGQNQGAKAAEVTPEAKPKKRTLASTQASPQEEMDPDMKHLDEIVQEAKRIKNETQLKITHASQQFFLNSDPWSVA
jgi:hypothetical protein